MGGNDLPALAAAVFLFAVAVPVSIAGANIGWGLMLAALIAARLRAEPVALDAWKGPLAYCLLFFLAASLLSSALGVDPGRSLRHFSQDAHKVWFYFLATTACAALLGPADTPLGGASGELPRAALPGPADTRLGPETEAKFALAAPAGLAIGFAAAAAVGIGQYLSSPSDVPVWDKVRAHAFVHPVTYGQQMSLAVIGAVCFALKPGGRRPELVRRAALALAAPAACALLLSNTRSALFACGAGLFTVFLLLPPLRKRLWIIILLSLLAWLAMEALRSDRSLIVELLQWDYSEQKHRGQFMRLSLWKAAWRMGLDHLWTGVGHNNFRGEFPRYARLVMEDKTAAWGTAHNLYLHHFAERGLLGFSALCALLWAFCAGAWRRARREPRAEHLFACATAAAFLVMNLTEVALQVEILWLLVFFIWIWSDSLARARAPS